MLMRQSSIHIVLKNIKAGFNPALLELTLLTQIPTDECPDKLLCKLSSRPGRSLIKRSIEP